jgi:hypothetical protein
LCKTEEFPLEAFKEEKIKERIFFVSIAENKIT